MSKFKKGTEWKTRGGWRAMVVDVVKDDMTYPLRVWHQTYNDDNDHTMWHRGDGSEELDGSLDDYDLIEPWEEPREIEIWLEVCEGSKGVVAFAYQTEAELKAEVADDTLETIASKKIIVKEGEFYDADIR